jgi:hypothetical protein
MDNFISQFFRLVIVFKCYIVYWTNDKGVYHETETLTLVVSYSFQDIKNEMDKFHPMKLI